MPTPTNPVATRRAAARFLTAAAGGSTADTAAAILDLIPDSLDPGQTLEVAESLNAVATVSRLVLRALFPPEHRDRLPRLIDMAAERIIRYEHEHNGGRQ